jgi:hypothetical protein
MKKNIILECDSFAIDKLKNWFIETDLHHQYRIYVITQNSRHELYTNRLADLEDVVCITYDQMFSYQTSEKLDPKLYADFTANYLNDHITPRMLDRDAFWPTYGIGVQNAFAYYTDIAYSILAFLKDHHIELVYFRNTPHEAIEWVLAKAVSFLGIAVYTTELFVLPWLYTICKGFQKERQPLLEDFKSNNEKELHYHIKTHIANISGDYLDAMPSYEKNRLSKGRLKFYNPFKNLDYTLSKPHNFINKTRNFFYYKKHSKEVNLSDTEYFVFFLHYQPERSTLPEGYDFVDQFYTIKILSLMLPDGVKLIVKEHPSTFTRTSEIKTRTLHNYKLLNRLENVIICPMHVDNFQLMDNAKAVSTITGTVALEAYARKKPVIVFGKSNLNVHGAHAYHTMEKLQEFVRQVVEDKIQIENVVDTLTQHCLKKSVSGIETPIEVPLDYYLKNNYRDAAHFALLEMLLIKDKAHD